MSETTRPGKHSEFRPQERNANSHTDRGMDMLASSIEEVGWIGAITVAADGEVFDGSARHEVAGHLMPENAVVIDHDGTKAVYIRRTDIPTAKDPRAIKAGILANRTAEINLDWAPDVMLEIGEDIDLTPWFTDAEMAEWDADDVIGSRFTDDPDEEIGSIMGGGIPLSIVLSTAEMEEWKILKETAGTDSDKTAFLKLMRGEL